MKFALDTFRDVVSGTPERRIQAILNFGLWFAVGAFVVSTAQYYLLPFESAVTPIVGGAAISIAAAALKLS